MRKAFLLLLSLYAVTSLLVMAKEVATPFVFSGRLDRRLTEGMWGNVAAALFVTGAVLTHYLTAKNRQSRFAKAVMITYVFGIPVALLAGACAYFLKATFDVDEDLKAYWRCQLIGSLTLGWICILYILWSAESRASQAARMTGSHGERKQDSGEQSAIG